jgi:hypothetical protein
MRLSRGSALLALAALCAAFVSVQGTPKPWNRRSPRTRARTRARTRGDRDATHATHSTNAPRLFSRRRAKRHLRGHADTTHSFSSRLRLPHQLRVVRRGYHVRMVRSRPDPSARERFPRTRARTTRSPRVPSPHNPRHFQKTGLSVSRRVASSLGSRGDPRARRFASAHRVRLTRETQTPRGILKKKKKKHPRFAGAVTTLSARAVTV